VLLFCLILFLSFLTFPLYALFVIHFIIT
jgi:hypothetical protein